MRNPIGSIFLLAVATAALLVLGPSCKAEQASTEKEPLTEIATGAMPIRVEAREARVQIHVRRDLRKIFTTKPYVSICEEPTCDGAWFEWVIIGGLEEDETLTIKDAPGHPACFPNSIPVEIHHPNNGAQTGPPDEACSQQKYGTYWPYIIEMKLADGTTFSNDPGGIIHKKR